MFRTIGDQPSLWVSLLPEEGAAAAGAGAGGCAAGLPGVLRPVRAVFRPADWQAIHASGVLSAALNPGLTAAQIATIAANLPTLQVGPLPVVAEDPTLGRAL